VETKKTKALREALAHIHRILDDEMFQLELVHPAMKAMLESSPAYDKDPNGSGPFGFTETNPIPVNGPIGQLAYLSRLETQSGQRILFHRLGAIGTVDVFEAVSFNGASGSSCSSIFTIPGARASPRTASGSRRMSPSSPASTSSARTSPTTSSRRRHPSASRA
jgi:hypothetical protein